MHGGKRQGSRGQEGLGRPWLSMSSSFCARSLRTSLIAGFACTRLAPAACGFDDTHGAIRIHKSFVGDAANIGLGNQVNAVNGAEKFAPVAVARLVAGQVGGEPLVISEAADKVGLGARLDHL